MSVPRRTPGWARPSASVPAGVGDARDGTPARRRAGAADLAARDRGAHVRARRRRRACTICSTRRIVRWDERYVPIPHDDWLRWMTGDSDFDPAVWWLAERDGELVGCALHWSSGWLKDLAVRESAARPRTRRRARPAGPRRVRAPRARARRAQGRRRQPDRRRRGSTSGSASSIERREAIWALAPVSRRREGQPPPLAAPPAPPARAAARAPRGGDRERRPGRGAADRRDASSSPSPAPPRRAPARRVGARSRRCRRTTWIPQARPEAKSSSASTSSAQPMKCRSGSSSVLPYTAARPGVERRASVVPRSSAASRSSTAEPSAYPFPTLGSIAGR